MTRIALVVLDTLRSDVFDAHFDWLAGTRFEKAWAPSHWTTPVHASLFTGRYPSEHGVHAKGQTFDVPGTTLIERLSTAGFTTRGFSANPNVSPAFDFDRGFDEFGGNTGIRSLSEHVYDWSAFTSEHADGGYLRYVRALRDVLASDCDTVDSLKWGLLLKLHESGHWSPTDSGASTALKWVQERTFDDDEFVFLNLMEAHDPYDRIPDEYRTNPDYTPPKNIGLEHVYEPPDLDEIWQSYEDAVRYLSDIYQRIFTELRSQFDYVVTVSDHGELLGEYGLWGHTYSLHEQLTQIPLVLSGKEFTDERRNEVVNLLDVHATIAELADIDSGDSRGQSLVGDVEPQSRLLEGHGLTVYRRESLEMKGYDVDPYDRLLRGVVTPPENFGHELTDEWVTVRGDRDSLQAALEMLVADLKIRDSIRDDELSESTMQHLRDLGYA